MGGTCATAWRENFLWELRKEEGGPPRGRSRQRSEEGGWQGRRQQKKREKLGFVSIGVHTGRDIASMAILSFNSFCAV